MSPRNLIPSGKIFLLPPNSKHVIAFLMSVESTLLAKANDIFIARLRLTQTPKNTRCHASGEPLIQIITPAQPQELFLLGRCKVLQPSTSSSQRSIQLETQDPDVGLSKGRSTRGGLVLCGCVRRINTCDDDPRSRYDLTRQVSAVVVWLSVKLFLST
jgi:hypothetical protein